MNFKEWFYSEMPLQRHGLYTHSDNPTDYPYGDELNKGALPFNVRDRKLIRDPGYWPGIAKTLEKKDDGQSFSAGGYNWNICFIENPIEQGKRGNNREYFRYVREKLEKEGYVLDNHITFVKNRSTGEAMTKWITFHTIGHALLDTTSDGVNDEVKAKNAQIKQKIKEILYQVADEYYKGHGQKVALDDNKVMNVVSRYFPHQSGKGSHDWKFDGGKHSGVQTLDEQIYELVAQYIMKNGIKLTEAAPFAMQKVPAGVATLPQGGKEVKVNFDELHPSKLGEGYLQKASMQINGLLVQALNNAVGHIIYHYRPSRGRTTAVPASLIRPGSRLDRIRGGQ